MLKNIILFDSPVIKAQLLPFTFTRPIADIRCGILTIKEKWEKRLLGNASFIVDEYLSKKYSTTITDENILIRADILPDNELITAILKLNKSEALTIKNEWIAAHVSKDEVNTFIKTGHMNSVKSIPYENHPNIIQRPWHIFQLNGEEIKKDFNIVAKGKLSDRISENNRLVNHSDIFIEEGADIEFSILNARNGPIYISKGAQIMEGSIIRGPFAALEGVELKMGSKVYGSTTLGPYCKVGGEVNNAVLFGYSNKAHDGYLGNAVIGEWCNLGADTNNSNLKNDYSDVKVWSYPDKSFIDTGLQFCGLMMGDHSKCGINSMFNTGTVVGVFCNIFGTGFPRNFIPSYSWGGHAGFTNYKFDKAMEVAKLVMQRRHIELTPHDIEILKYVYELKDR